MKRLFPFLLCLGALLLRLWGIGWGLPSADHTFSYHTDETLLLSSSLAVHPLLLLFDPGFYEYGCLAQITNGLILDLGTWTHLVTPGASSPSALLACRLVTAALGAATCGVLFATGKRLWGTASGVVAGALYAVAPLAVQHGHFATVDVHATFWTALCLLQTSKILTSESKRAILWAGAFAGLSAAAKYNAGVVLLAPLAASFFKITPWPPIMGKIVSPGPDNGERKPLSPLLGSGVVLLAALAGFVVGCPAIFLNPKGMLEGILHEAGISRTDHGGIFAGLPPAYLTQVLQSFWTMGMFLPFAVALALIFALVRRKPADIALLAFIIPYFIMIGLSKAMYARYALPLFPPLFLLVGALATAPKRTTLVRGLIAASGASALLLSGWLNLEMSTPDTRDRALVWIRAQNFKKIGFATGPWHYHPPLVPNLTHPQPAKAKEAAAESGFLVPADGEWNVEQLKAENPDAVVLSESEYVRIARTNDPKARAFLAELAEFGKQEFKPDDAMGRITRLNLPARVLPYDMGYVSPSIVVFSRR